MTTATEPRTIKHLCNESRLRVRCFGEERIDEIIDRVRTTAIESGKLTWKATHAGDVPNCYDYPAQTTGLFVASDASGNVLAISERLAANKVTPSGVARHCLGEEYRPLADDRYGDDKRQAAIDLLRQMMARECGE